MGAGRQSNFDWCHFPAQIIPRKGGKIIGPRKKSDLTCVH